MGTPAIIQNATNSDNDAGISGVLSRLWRGANEGVVSPDALTLGYDKDLQNYADSPPTLEESEHPILTGARKGLAQFASSAAHTVSGLTSPVGIATAALGEVTQAPGALGRAAKALQVGTGAAFGAQGAKQAYDAAKQGDVSGTLAGAGQGLLGAAGAAAGVGAEARDPYIHPAAQSILDSVKTRGGATVSLHDGDLTGSNNYAVSLHPETTTRIRGELTPEAITDFISKHEPLLSHPQSAMGVWSGPDGHYMEVSAVTPNKNAAIAAGQKHNQVEVYDLKRGMNIPVGGTGGVLDAPEGNMFLQDSRNAYNLLNGLPETGGTYLRTDPRATAIADAYEAMQHTPHDPAVQASYGALKNDIAKQWDFATNKLGYTFEPWTHEGQPYANSREMMDDVANNKHLYFFQGGDMPADHPLAELNPHTGLAYNDMLRAVHDLFGHATDGYEFGPRGEENAWFKHTQMFSPEAVPALTTETRGQNSWVNFGPHMRSIEDGHLLQKDEPGYLAPNQRPFAQQKAGLLPPEFYGRDEASRFADIPPGPPKEPVALRHYSDQKIQGDVISGDRRASSPEASVNERMRSQMPDFQPAAAFYRDGELSGRHPLITQRKFEYPVKGNFALAEIESNPIWQKAQADAQEQALANGAQPHEAYLASLNAAEKAIRDEGYDGYYSKANPSDVRMFGDVPVSKAEGEGAIQLQRATQGGFARLGKPRKGLASGRELATGVQDAAALPMSAPASVQQTPELSTEGIQNPQEINSPASASVPARVTGTNSDPSRLLFPHERAQALTPRLSDQFVQNLANLPQVEDFVNAAKSGAIGKNWYQRSKQAFDAMRELAPNYFRPDDADRWANVVAATSPQQGVYANLREALAFWKQWHDAGRPMTKSALLNAMGVREIKTGNSVGYRRIRGTAQEIDPLSVMNSKLNNVVKAINGEDLLNTEPGTKYFKVGNFARNLQGNLDHVTNDSWMGVFSNAKENIIPRPQMYHALAVRTREAANELGWKPAEAQAAVWVFTKTLAEMSGWKGSTKSIHPVDKLPELTPEKMSTYAQDFADIMRNDSEVRRHLTSLGVDLDVLDKRLEQIAAKPSYSSRTYPRASAPSLERSAGRIAKTQQALPGFAGYADSGPTFNFGANEESGNVPSVIKRAAGLR